MLELGWSYLLSYENRRKLERASYIYHRLLTNGEIDLNDEVNISMDYKDEEIYEYINIFVSDCQSILFESEGILYMIPDVDNKLLSYTNAELKDEILWKRADMTDLYVSYYIFIIYCSLIYEGEGYNPRTRDSVRIDDFVRIVDLRLRNYLQQNSSDELVFDRKIKFNVVAIAKRWNVLETYKDRKNSQNQKSQIGYIIKTFEFFKKQGIVLFANKKTEISPTKKLDEIVKHYYTHHRRAYYLIKLFGGEEIEYKQD